MIKTTNVIRISVIQMATWLLVWFSGIILANGFWSTFFAVVTLGIYSIWVIAQNIVNSISCF